MARLSKGDLREITRRTLAFYDAEAEWFDEGTRDHDVSQNLDALLENLEGPSPHDVLDLGCGPGRDLIALTARGCNGVGLDGAEAFVSLARERSGCEVWQQDFLGLDLPPERFDGIFANASLFHVPSQELPRVLRELWATLRPNGVLFSSNPRGDNREGWNAGRYGSFHDLDSWRRFCTEAGFREVRHYYRPPGKPRNQQPWLASVWRKPP